MRFDIQVLRLGLLERTSFCITVARLSFWRGPLNIVSRICYFIDDDEGLGFGIAYPRQCCVHMVHCKLLDSRAGVNYWRKIII